MRRAVLCLVATAILAWPKDIYADPSKPIRDAMNHPASAFDLYMHTLRIDLEQEFNQEREAAKLGQFIASLIERADLVDDTAKEGEEFSAEFVQALKSRPSFHFSGFDYDFQASLFTLRLDLQTPDSFPALQTDLSFEGEKERKLFMEEVVRRAWGRVSFKLPTHRIQNGYTSKSFDEDAFLEEVAANTKLVVYWRIHARIPRETNRLAKLLGEKGVSIRTYKGTRSKSGAISVEDDDFIPKERDIGQANGED